MKVLLVSKLVVVYSLFRKQLQNGGKICKIVSKEAVVGVRLKSVLCYVQVAQSVALAGSGVDAAGNFQDEAAVLVGGAETVDVTVLCSGLGGIRIPRAALRQCVLQTGEVSTTSSYLANMAVPGAAGFVGKLQALETVAQSRSRADHFVPLALLRVGVAQALQVAVLGSRQAHFAGHAATVGVCKPKAVELTFRSSNGASVLIPWTTLLAEIL